MLKLEDIKDKKLKSLLTQFQNNTIIIAQDSDNPEVSYNTLETCINDLVTHLNKIYEQESEFIDCTDQVIEKYLNNSYHDISLKDFAKDQFGYITKIVNDEERFGYMDAVMNKK